MGGGPMSRTLLFAVAASAAACAGETDVRYSGTVAVQSPELVTVDNGVQVLADADEPVFYTDNYYWLFRDGGWYRSPDYRQGWARVQVELVPQPLKRIDRPQAYVHYRRHERERAVTTQRENVAPRAPEQRDLREPTREPQKYPQPERGPT